MTMQTFYQKAIQLRNKSERTARLSVTVEIAEWEEKIIIYEIYIAASKDYKADIVQGHSPNEALESLKGVLRLMGNTVDIELEKEQ